MKKYGINISEEANAILLKVQSKENAKGKKEPSKSEIVEAAIFDYYSYIG